MLPPPRSESDPQASFSSDHPDHARRIDVRPRQGPAREEAPAETEITPLHFSCPNCLHMLAAPRQSVTVSVKCPECGAFVMPPQLVSLSVAKTTLPPPKKSGMHTLMKKG